MGSIDTVNVTKTLEKMIELELVISDFYKTCSNVWEEDRGFWSHLAQAEVLHADYLKKMIALLNMNPQAFELGRPLNNVAINTAISGIQTYIEKLKKGALKKKQVLFLARDTEQSILESKYSEVLKTKNMECLDLISEITTQTEMHRTLLNKKIEESKDTA